MQGVFDLDTRANTSRLMGLLMRGLQAPCHEKTTFKPASTHRNIIEPATGRPIQAYPAGKAHA
jgi:hypothetical protein